MRWLYVVLWAVLWVSTMCAQHRPQPVFPNDGLILGEGVKVRSEPSTKGEIVVELPFATYVRILGKSEHSQQIGQKPIRFFWANVQTADGKTGWVFGRYVNSLQPFVKDKCAFTAPDGECFQWVTTRYNFTDFVDGDLEIMDDVLHLFRSVSNPQRFFPVRNVRTLDKAFAFDGHWHTRLNCCMIVDRLSEYRQTNGSLDILWEEGIDDDYDKIQYKITFENGFFQLDWGKSLERYFVDWVTGAPKTEKY